MRTDPSLRGRGRQPVVLAELCERPLLNYWVDEADGTVFCLVEAPDAETAAAVQPEAHGLVADEIIPVTEGT